MTPVRSPLPLKPTPGRESLLLELIGSMVPLTDVPWERVLARVDSRHGKFYRHLCARIGMEQAGPKGGGIGRWVSSGVMEQQRDGRVTRSVGRPYP